VQRHFADHIAPFVSHFQFLPKIEGAQTSQRSCLSQGLHKAEGSLSKKLFAKIYSITAFFCLTTLSKYGVCVTASRKDLGTSYVLESNFRKGLRY